jgi:hypothetical protein
MKPDFKPCVIVSGGTQQTCTNEPVKIMPVNRKKRVFAKVPVILAEIDVQIDVLSTITLPEEALEIKEIKKKLKLTQCRLIQAFRKKHWEGDWDGDSDSEWDNDAKDWDSHHEKRKKFKFKLFIEGFVRKNIDYSVVQCKNKFGICGDIRHCTVDVPFSCVTTIEEFNGSPPLPIVFNSKEEFEFFKSAPLPPSFPEKDRVLSGDLSEFNQCSFEFFNEMPFCELVSSKICEHNEFLHLRSVHDGPFEERTFKEFSEKMVIDITLKILQNQQVRIPPFYFRSGAESEE